MLHPFLSTTLESRVPAPIKKMFNKNMISPTASLTSTADALKHGTSPVDYCAI